MALQGIAEHDLANPIKKLGSAHVSGRLVWLSSGSLLFASVEAICLFLVSANGLALALGGSAIGLTQGALFFHSAVLRLPILAAASAMAVLNLGLLVNQWRLRRLPSAKWRMRPLSLKERRRILLIAAMSVLALVLVATELYLHHKLHGSAFAYSLVQPAFKEFLISSC